MKCKFIFLVFAILLIYQFCDDPSNEKRKIKLRAERSEMVSKQKNGPTIIKLDAVAKKSIAVLIFENQTSNRALDWLSQGITDMLIRDLSQSHNLNVVILQRLMDIITNLKIQSLKTIDYQMLSKIGAEARVEAVMKGSFSNKKDSLVIDVQLFDFDSGALLQQNLVTGYGLEKVFSMVDDLSNKVKTDLKLSLEEAEDLNISDITTNSLDAYQHYTYGFDLVYKAYFGDAIQELEKAIQYDSTFAMAHLWASIVYPMLGKEREAKKSIAKALKYSDHASPKEKMKIQWINSLYTNKHKEGFNILTKLVQEYPDDKELHYQLAGNYYYRKEIDKTQQELRRVFELDPNYVMAYMLQSIVYEQSAKFDSAIISLKKAIEISPNDAVPYNNLGDIYARKGDYKSAEKYYQKALAVKPDFFHSSLGLARLYSSAGKYDKARGKYIATLNILPSEELKATVYSGLALVDRFQGKYNEAILHLNQALQFPTSNSRRSNYNVMLAGIYLRKAKYDSTLAIARRILSIDRENFYVFNILCDALLKQGQIDSAKAYTETLDQFIENSKYEILRTLHFQMLAKICAVEGKFDEAILHYEKILSSNPEANSVYEDMGKVYLESNQPLKAIESYQKYLKKDPNQALAKYHLALAYDAAGKKKHARKTMREFLKMWENADPDIPELIQAKEFFRKIM